MFGFHFLVAYLVDAENTKADVDFHSTQNSSKILYEISSKDSLHENKPHSTVFMSKDSVVQMFRGFYKGLTVGAYVCGDGSYGLSDPFDQKALTSSMTERAATIIKDFCENKPVGNHTSDQEWLDFIQVTFNGLFNFGADSEKSFDSNSAETFETNASSHLEKHFECSMLDPKRMYKFNLSDEVHIKELEFSQFPSNIADKPDIQWTLKATKEDENLPLEVTPMSTTEDVCHQLIHDLFYYPGFQAFFGTKPGVPSNLFQQILSDGLKRNHAKTLKGLNKI
jgi:hypothetical protein